LGVKSSGQEFSSVLLPSFGPTSKNQQICLNVNEVNTFRVDIDALLGFGIK
jgi:hypothetical protein